MKVETEYFGCLKIGAVTLKSRVTLARDKSHLTRDTNQTRDSDDERLRTELGEQLGPSVG